MKKAKTLKQNILELAGNWNTETVEKVHQDIKQSRKWKQRI